MTITQQTPYLRRKRARLAPATPASAGAYPQSIGPLGLLDLLQSYVAETVDLQPRAEPGLTERAYELLELTDELEIWAIHWPQGQGLELHDHGGAAFGPRYVHDVVNSQAAPATSVHAYSPPMESMTFYRHEAHGLVVDRAEYRADPSWAP